MKLFLFALVMTVNSFAKDFMPSSFSANFEESFISAATGKEKKSFGKIDYKYPGHIRFEKTSPDPSLFVSNPQKSWYYVPPFVEGESGQVTIQKSSKLPLTKFLDSIKKGVEGSKIFTHKYRVNDLVLSFDKSIQKEMTLKEVTLHASKEAVSVTSLKDFEKLTLEYADGRKVFLKFIDLKENTSFAGNHFEFTVPPKTKTTNN